ncbi:hypothetical protein D9M69_665400 [compost metagenome]
MVVGRGADAAAAEHHVATGKGFAQRRRDAVAVVTDQAHPGQRQTTLRQQLDDLGQVFVAALAGKDFIADDDQTEIACHV